MPDLLKRAFSFPYGLCGLLVAALLLGGAGAADAQVSLRSSLSVDEDAAPGTTYEGTIALRNEDSTATRSAEVSLSDYRFDHEGNVRYEDPGSHDRSNAPWINLESTLVDVPPEETVEFTYEVSVPETAGEDIPEGTYWSMILVEPLGQEPDIDMQEGLAVQQVRRYGIQVATNIEGTGSSDLEVLGTGLDTEGETPELTIDLENQGTLMDRPPARLELYDEAGAQVLETASSAQRIYPGTSVRHRFALEDVPPGSYQALLVFDSEVGSPTGVQFTLDL